MDAIKFLKEKIRMCNKNCCEECPLGSANNGTGKGCEYLGENYTEKYIEIVKKWSDEHPIETRQS